MKCLILAAGKSKRMKSEFPKWYLKINYIKIIDYLLDTLESLNIDYTMIINSKQIDYCECEYTIQNELYTDTFGPLMSYSFDENENYLIINADMPFLKKEFLNKFIGDLSKSNFKNGIVVGYANSNYQGVKIKKNKLKLSEKSSLKNMGVYILNGKSINDFKNIYMDSYNMTLPEFLQFARINLYIQKINYDYSFININTQNDLRIANNYIRNEIKNKCISNDISDFNQLRIDNKSVILNNKIGRNVEIINSKIINSSINDNSIIRNSIINDNNIIGPSIDIEDSQIGINNYLGSFLQIKRSIIGNNNFMKHFSYIGDSKIGNFNNFGAMTVISNYNGVEKNKTLIGDYNFIGSFTNIIAPRVIGSNNYIASMTKIAKNIDDNKFISEKHQLDIKENTFNI